MGRFLHRERGCVLLVVGLKCLSHYNSLFRFIRTQGGMSVVALRGDSGSDFEAKAAVLRGAPKKDILKRWLPLFFDERDFVAYGEVKQSMKLVLIVVGLSHKVYNACIP